ncbi:hypothetical protein B0H10DRAFT_1864939, partial [Mycena sp. CBHHK59/15]
GHKPPKSLSNICVEKFGPNLTAHIQPMDAGIICCFKAHFWRFSMQRALDRYDEGVTPAHIYDIDQLQAMQLAELAWREAGANTLYCWRKAGILPTVDSLSDEADLFDGHGHINANAKALVPAANDTSDPVIDAEVALSQVLGELQEVGVLQKNNVVDIEDLVHMPKEQIIKDATDKEIFEVVQKMRAREQDREQNSGDDEEGEPKPTRKEALQAVSTSCKYIADLDEPFARKMEGMLSTFGRETRREEARAMIDMSITDFFVRK